MGAVIRTSAFICVVCLLLWWEDEDEEKAMLINQVTCLCSVNDKTNQCFHHWRMVEFEKCVLNIAAVNK